MRIYVHFNVEIIQLSNFYDYHSPATSLLYVQYGGAAPKVYSKFDAKLVVFLWDW